MGGYFEAGRQEITHGDQLKLLGLKTLARSLNAQLKALTVATAEILEVEKGEHGWFPGLVDDFIYDDSTSVENLLEGHNVKVEPS
jgi:hypothetical protein